MNMVQRNQILFILTGLNLSLKKAASGGLMETEAREVVDEALPILKRQITPCRDYTHGLRD